MAYGFEILEQGTGKVLYSSKTVYHQIIDSFQVSSTSSGSKTIAGFSNIKAYAVPSVFGCVCVTSVVGNTVSWSWENFGSPCSSNNAKAIIYVYSI